MSRQATWTGYALTTSTIASLVASLFILSPASSSATLTLAASVGAPAFSVGDVFFIENFWYEARSLLSTSQGLSSTSALSTSIFNPGADIDLTTTTDFEDLAGPAADVLEFGDQDRALLADSLSSTIFFNGVLGGLVGLSTHMILSSDLWRFI